MSLWDSLSSLKIMVSLAASCRSCKIFMDFWMPLIARTSTWSSVRAVFPLISGGAAKAKLSRWFNLFWYRKSLKVIQCSEKKMSSGQQYRTLTASYNWSMLLLLPITTWNGQIRNNQYNETQRNLFGIETYPQPPIWTRYISNRHDKAIVTSQLSKLNVPVLQT